MYSQALRGKWRITWLSTEISCSREITKHCLDLGNRLVLFSSYYGHAMWTYFPLINTLTCSTTEYKASLRLLFMAPVLQSWGTDRVSCSRTEPSCHKAGRWHRLLVLPLVFNGLTFIYPTDVGAWTAQMCSVLSRTVFPH